MFGARWGRLAQLRSVTRCSGSTRGSLPDTTAAGRPTSRRGSGEHWRGSDPPLDVGRGGGDGRAGIGRAHVWTPVTSFSRMPSSALKKKNGKQADDGVRG